MNIFDSPLGRFFPSIEKRDGKSTVRKIRAVHFHISRWNGSKVLDIMHIVGATLSLASLHG